MSDKSHLPKNKINGWRIEEILTKASGGVFRQTDTVKKRTNGLPYKYTERVSDAEQVLEDGAGHSEDYDIKKNPL